MESEWRHELEALQRLLAKQQSQISTLHKQLGAYKQAVDGRFAREGDYGAPGTPLIVR